MFNHHNEYKSPLDVLTMATVPVRSSKVPPQNLFTSHDDRMFVFDHLPLERLVEAGWPSINRDTARSMLDEAGRIIGRKIAPAGPDNDHNPFTVKDGELVPPASFLRYQEIVRDHGLAGTFTSEEYGGLGLPMALNTFLGEMLFQADPGYATTTMLSGGVADLIQAYASEELKQKYLPDLASGKLTGCMDITEPGAGSDVFAISATKAFPDGNGTAIIKGNKIFITNGGADVHMVLAKDHDDGQLSLYLVPKIIDGRSNHVQVMGLEEKLGLHTSPTCRVEFGDGLGFEKGSGKDEAGSLGYLVGQKGKGVPQMFKLMINARLQVGGQGLGTIEASLLATKRYAVERRQFGKPIAELGPVTKMLAEMQIQSEAIRAVLYETAFSFDMAKALHDTGKPEDAQVHANRAAVLTPLIKFYAAEEAVRLTRWGIQIHGGYGFTKEFDVERHFRNAPIIAIYEGTSQIQVSQFLEQALYGVAGMKCRANLSQVVAEMRTELQQMTYKPCFEDERRTTFRGEGLVLPSLKQNMLGTLDLLDQSLDHLRSVYADVMTMQQGLSPEGLSPKDVFNYISPGAEPLATMAVEAYAAFLLLRQAQEDPTQHKEVSAISFIRRLEAKAGSYAREIQSIQPETLNELMAAARLD